MQFQKNKGKDVLALINFKGKISVMTLICAVKLGLKVQMTDIGTLKIVNSLTKIYGIIISTF